MFQCTHICQSAIWGAEKVVSKTPNDNVTSSPPSVPINWLIEHNNLTQALVIKIEFGKFGKELHLCSVRFNAEVRHSGYFYILIVLIRNKRHGGMCCLNPAGAGQCKVDI